jgi:outer membrane protein assembly factor BamB
LVVVAAYSMPASGQEATWGWRGDGTGLFPNANPPVKWGRVSATLKGLTTQAEKPQGEAPGKNAAVLGNIPEWLVLGPIPYDAETPRKELLAKEFVLNEAAMRPDAGEKTAGSEWRKVPSTGSLLNLNVHYQDMSAKVFYAHAWLHSKDGGRLRLRLMGPTCRFWFNGEDVLSLEEKSLHHLDKEVELKKGWNSLLVKVFTTRRKDMWATNYHCPPDSGFFQVVMWGRSDGETYEEKNILWEAPLPQAVRFSCAQPLVIGDRVIVNADPSFLICYDKMTGKRLWVDYCGHYEFVTDAERQANPEIFQQIDTKAKRIKELAASSTGTFAEDVELTSLVAGLAKLMKQVDGKKYAGVAGRQEAGSSGMTSVTNGRFVYTWFADGVAVCHDLEGKRKWMTLENQGPSGGGGIDYHGYQISPILTDTELVVCMMKTTAFDRETGKVLWRMPTKQMAWPPLNPGEPIAAEGTTCVNYENLGLYKPGVGFFPWSKSTIAGNKGYVLPCDRAESFEEVTLPKDLTAQTKLTPRRVKMVREEDQPLITTGSWSSSYVVASLLIHDGLIYTVAMGGPLRVYDAETLDPVYRVRLDMNTIMFAYPYPHGSGVCASPALGGKNIFIFGNGGHSMVIKPGRTFEVVAENRIERLMPGGYQAGLAVLSEQGFYPECTVSSPIFDGDRIYYQGEGFLYCIGGK